MGTLLWKWKVRGSQQEKDGNTKTRKWISWLAERDKYCTSYKVWTPITLEMWIVKREKKKIRSELTLKNSHILYIKTQGKQKRKQVLTVSWVKDCNSLILPVKCLSPSLLLHLFRSRSSNGCVNKTQKRGNRYICKCASMWLAENDPTSSPVRLAHRPRWGRAGPILSRPTAKSGAPLPPLRPPAGVHSSSLAAAGGETSWVYGGKNWEQKKAPAVSPIKCKRSSSLMVRCITEANIFLKGRYALKPLS